MGKTNRYNSEWKCGGGRRRRNQNRKFRQETRNAIRRGDFRHFDQVDYRNPPQRDDV